MKDKVYKSPKSQIIMGTPKPNMHSSEPERSEAFNISRAPIRDALNMPKKDAFVTITFRERANVSGNSNSSCVNY